MTAQEPQLVWDETKRLTNIEKHGLDFLDAIELLDGPHLVLPATTVGGEARSIAIGLVEGRVLALIFTRRDGAIRCISLRKARKREREHHEALLGG